METILVVDDESHIVELLKFNLEKEGYKVEAAFDGPGAVAKAQTMLPDLMILDLMLPGMTGLEVCKILHNGESTQDIPIIMLTAKSEEIDKVLGLEMGADDYITKPFSPRELLARVKARLRRVRKDAERRANEEIRLEYGELVLDLERIEVTAGERQLDLTHKEFELLKVFLANPGKVFTREALLETVWGYDYYGDSRTVDVHIRHLRQKIEEDPANPQYIDTVRGVGYRLKENKDKQ
ncbi:MAG TPA: response regulator transcription factor [Bacillota bacterium]|nr:response regulator transcription factor [Bacillota bacterium]